MPETLQPFRWTLNRAADELGEARPKVRSRLARAGFAPAEDGTYTTKQIIDAMFGDADAEALRKLKAQADMAEMERDVMDRNLLPADIVEAAWQNAISEMKDVVMSLDLPTESRARVMAALKSIPLNDYTAEKANALPENPEEEP